MVVIRHPVGSVAFATRYDHLRNGSIVVEPGQIVRRGDKIAEVGSAGNSTGPHLRFEVWVGGYLRPGRSLGGLLRAQPRPLALGSVAQAVGRRERDRGARPPPRPAAALASAMRRTGVVVRVQRRTRRCTAGAADAAPRATVALSSSPVATVGSTTPRPRRARSTSSATWMGTSTRTASASCSATNAVQSPGVDDASSQDRPGFGAIRSIADEDALGSASDAGKLRQAARQPVRRRSEEASRHTERPPSTRTLALARVAWTAA
ncbi:MAG: M23 family metallopeptidase [Polyangiaceae bacterium]|nr:M23 family metallopeptidase [Polyangiaceae bacterium]